MYVCTLQLVAVTSIAVVHRIMYSCCQQLHCVDSTLTTTAATVARMNAVQPSLQK